jgi:hypothetical protein
MNWFDGILLETVRECTGINIWIAPEGDFKVFLTVLYRKGKTLKIIKTLTYEDLSGAIEQMPARSPLMVSIDGYGIIHKSVSIDEIDEGLNKVLPNAKLSDFYIQKIKQSENEKIIFSLSRKETVNEIISTLNDAGFYPFNIILGPFSFINLLRLIPPEEEINIPGYSFTISNKVVISFQRKEQIKDSLFFSFGDKKILSDYLVAITNCLYFFSSNDLINNNITSLISQKDEFLKKKAIHFVGITLLLLIFLSLLINASLFYRYTSENQMHKKSIKTGNRLLRETDSLSKIIAGRETLDEANNDKASKLFAYYSDRIASVIPGMVIVDGICICPQGKTIKNGNTHIYRRGIISISGSLNKSEYLDQIIKRISLFGWVKEIQITNYKDQGSGSASFELEIKTR